MSRKYLITTLGCKVNQYETQQIRELLESLGFEPAMGPDIPDVAVVNTCAVTATASRKSRQALRRLGRSGARLIAAVGCAASEDAERLLQCARVSLVIGHDADIREALRKAILKDFKLTDSGVNRSEFPLRPISDFGERTTGRNDVWMNPVFSGTSSVVAGADSSSDMDIVPPSLAHVKRACDLVGPIRSFAGHQRAFLKIQDGCDAFCTYCIIPQLRPNLRSKSIESAVAEARSLVDHGHKEIILTGIFLGAFGRGTALRRRFGEGDSPLGRLVDALSDIHGLKRLRLSSLEPGDVDAALLSVLASKRACAPHLHLPLQSGSAKILRRMNRQYTRADFMDMVVRVRASLDRPAISTDIIVGFPGETDKDFEQTLEVVRRVGFVKVHAFPFSARTGTAASRWQKDFVPAQVVRERMTELAAVGRETSFLYRQSLVGETERVIVEKCLNGSVFDVAAVTTVRGRCDRYFEVHFECADHEPNALKPGDLASVRIDRVTPLRTHGTCVAVGAVTDTTTRSLPVLQA